MKGQAKYDSTPRFFFSSRKSGVGDFREKEYCCIVLAMIKTQANDTRKWQTRGERDPGESGAAPPLLASQRGDLRVAAVQMRGAGRRALQAEVVLKYCHGSVRRAETLFGWSREVGEVGFGARRTGRVCLGVQSAGSGGRRWEEKYLEAAQTLRELAEAHAQSEKSR